MTALTRIFHENFNFHLSGEPNSLHLLRCRPLAVSDYSFTTCNLHLKQIQLVKYPANRDIQKADMMNQQPTLLFKRERDTLLEVMIEPIDSFKGNFGQHTHTLENIPEEWF